MANRIGGSRDIEEHGKSCQIRQQILAKESRVEINGSVMWVSCGEYSFICGKMQGKRSLGVVQKGKYRERAGHNE